MKPFWHLFVTRILTYKCAQLNLLLCRSSQERILENFSYFSQKVRSPSKFIEHSNIESVLGFLTLFILGIFSRHNGESCEHYSNIASCKILVFLEQGKASILNLQVSAEFEY
jgi:hypothetical protein